MANTKLGWTFICVLKLLKVIAIQFNFYPKKSPKESCPLMKKSYICTIVILFCVAAYLRYRNDTQNEATIPVVLDETQSNKITQDIPTEPIINRTETKNSVAKLQTHDWEKDVWVNQAIEGFDLIQNMMPEFEVNGNNERLMSALQRILLEDDLKFALRKRGCMNPVDLESAYKALAKGQSISELLPTQKSVKKDLEKTRNRLIDSDKRSKYVEKLQYGNDPFSQQLIPVFDRFDDMELNPRTHVELLKDVICYLSMESDSHDRFESLLQDVGEVSEFRTEYEKQIAAIRKVYAFRFQELHGYDPDFVFDTFKNIKLSNINIHPLREYE